MIKAYLNIVLAFLLSTHILLAQNGASVNTTGSPAHPSAIFDASSNSQGFLIPRMTLLERNAINFPADGLMVFTTDCKNISIYVNSEWQPLNQSMAAPYSPIASSHTEMESEIIWQWNAVPGANGYKWSSVNDYYSALDLGVNTNYILSGLICNSNYNIYVWAYNDCGHSHTSVFNAKTGVCTLAECGLVNTTYNGSAIVYGTVFGFGGTCWLDRNLGASQAALSEYDAFAYGGTFQWGRLDDGHQIRTGNTTSFLSNSDNPGHSEFITVNSWPNDWRNPQNDNLWQGFAGTNNPCPAGFRLPTEMEVFWETQTWNPMNSSGAFTNNLKWTAGGLREYNNGGLAHVASSGLYWTSTTDGNRSRYLDFSSGGSYTDGRYRADGLSIRCIMD
jgi:hypothetical protein